ncbi:MAG: peptidase M20 [Ignavibacteriales bacterium CG_4_9_14_3_um_filter_34_10]|nr:MAG: peptidase M20 [Ignavibacteriales bacterium CG_4_9_14_3_um_filter_34_10]
MKNVLESIDQNKERYLDELKDYLRIPSISTLPESKQYIIKCSNFVADELKRIGMDKTEIFKTDNHPIVYGEKFTDAKKPTVLIYGHYDVQPVDPLELWSSDPFDPVVKDGKIYARGANDNKGQNFVHMKSVEAYLNTKGELPVNVKFLIEGEEEIGSISLAKFIKTHKELLKCDVVLISDTSIYAPNVPTINYGLRGLCYMEVEVIAANRDLHSGSFGGGVANPINELARIIAKLHDKNFKVTIPGFYDDVIKLSAKEKENYRKLNFSDSKFAKELKVKELQGEKGYSTLERLSARPTLDCNGIVGGFIQEGAKTVLPSKASTKISMRLVPNQNPDKIAKLFTKYIKEITPNTVKVNIKNLHGGLPFLVTLDNKYIQAAANAVSKAFGGKTMFTREGGSIPIVVDFANLLKAPVILMGLGLDTDDIHSPNEHFHLSNFYRGIKSSALLFDEIKNF